jgi:hypothetical protein
MKLLATVRSRPARTRLMAAIESRDRARQELEERREVLERLQTVVDRADVAARAAADATRAANDFRAEWVRAGCRYSESRELQSLADVATAAAGVAQRASVDADAIRKGNALRQAQSALESAQSDIRGSEDAITAAIAVIIAAEAGPTLERFERAAADYRAARSEVMGVLAVLEQEWSLDSKNRMNPAHEGEAAIEAALERGKIKSFHDEGEGQRARDYLDKTSHHQEWLASLSAPWRSRAAALREDPNA